jgi:hypothetical protein
MKEEELQAARRSMETFPRRNGKHNHHGNGNYEPGDTAIIEVLERCG